MSFLKPSHPSAPTEPTAPRSFFRNALIFAWELVKVVVISTAIIVPVRYFLIQPFYVKGASMEPNFEDHEYLIIDELSYRFRPPLRGEVVVFRYPLNPKEYFIKRIIGLPNERIDISDGRISITPVGATQPIVLDESYLQPGTKVEGVKSYQLQPGEYYVMGDNRGESLDSRYFGPVERRFVTGRVIVRGWPPQRFGLFLEAPTYNVP